MFRDKDKIRKYTMYKKADMNDQENAHNTSRHRNKGVAKLAHEILGDAINILCAQIYKGKVEHEKSRDEGQGDTRKQRRRKIK